MPASSNFNPGRAYKTSAAANLDSEQPESVDTENTEETVEDFPSIMAGLTQSASTAKTTPNNTQAGATSEQPKEQGDGSADPTQIPAVAAAPICAPTSSIPSAWVFLAGPPTRLLRMCLTVILRTRPRIRQSSAHRSPHRRPLRRLNPLITQRNHPIRSMFRSPLLQRLARLCRLPWPAEKER